MADHSHHPEKEHKNISPPARRMYWFFEEFWPIVLFGALFVLMVSIPLVLSGLFADLQKFSTSDSVWWIYGLIITGAFLVALVMTFLAPRLLLWYILLLGVSGLILAEGATATNWGVTLAVTFIGYILFAMFFITPKPVRRKDK